ncbi:MAG: RecX family transcriptional regulator [bacterium]
MKIKSIKKVKGLYEIVFDQEVIKYHEEVIVKYNLLRNNIEVSDEVYNNTLLDNRYFFSRDRAIKYIVNLKFKSQIKEHLLKTEEYFIVSRVIDDLEKYKIIDDSITANCYVISKYNKGYGNKELIRKLNDLRVNKEIINKVIEENRELELECLEKYFNKLITTLKSLNNRDLRKKIDTRLVSHGYNFEDIKNIMDNVIDVVHNDDILDKYFDKAVRKYLEEKDKYIQEKKMINFLMGKGFEFDLIKNKINLWKESN